MAAAVAFPPESVKGLSWELVKDEDVKEENTGYGREGGGRERGWKVIGGITMPSLSFTPGSSHRNDDEKDGDYNSTT